MVQGAASVQDIHMPINLKDVKCYHSRPARLGGSTNETVEPIIVDGEERF